MITPFWFYPSLYLSGGSISQIKLIRSIAYTLYWTILVPKYIFVTQIRKNVNLYPQMSVNSQNTYRKMMHKGNKGNKTEFGIFLLKRSLRIIEKLRLLRILGKRLWTHFREGSDSLIVLEAPSLGVMPIRFIKQSQRQNPIPLGVVSKCLF